MDRNDALRLAFADKSVIGHERAVSRYAEHQSASEQDTDQHDSHDINGPQLQGDTLAGVLNRMRDMIKDGNSVQAIDMALDFLGRHESLPKDAVDSVNANIGRALDFVNLDGGYGEELRIKRRLIDESGIATNWDQNVLDLDRQGFESVLQNIRAANSSSARLPEDLGIVARIPTAA